MFGRKSKRGRKTLVHRVDELQVGDWILYYNKIIEIERIIPDDNVTHYSFTIVNKMFGCKYGLESRPSHELVAVSRAK